MRPAPLPFKLLRATYVYCYNGQSCLQPHPAQLTRYRKLKYTFFRSRVRAAALPPPWSSVVVGYRRGLVPAMATYGACPHPALIEEHTRTSTVKYIALFLIRLYQRTLSVVLPSSCRFTPSCSHYGYEAIQRFGFFRGGWMTVKRIGRCHPFYHGNLYDPVPERLAD